MPDQSSFSEEIKPKETSRKPPVIGWREWVGLPELNIPKIKAKIDTGASTSSLHAFQVDEFEKEDQKWVRIFVHPIQRDTDYVVEVEAPVLEYRSVRSSNGESEIRPVIVTTAKMSGVKWPIQITLTNREKMGFRMLIGREALSERFLVDSSGSYLGKKRKKKKPIQ